MWSWGAQLYCQLVAPVLSVDSETEEELDDWLMRLCRSVFEIWFKFIVQVYIYF